MTRALVWKEVREQRAVWLALALAAAGGVAGLSALLPAGGNRDETLTGVLWFAAWGYGLVCGALLLAGEAEDGTQPFLDTLPGTRRRLWGVKAATGLLLVAAQLAALAAVGFVFLRGRFGPDRAALGAGGMVCGGVIGYAWGLFCGSYAANVLAAIARAVLLQVLAAPLLLVVATLALQATLPASGLAEIPGARLLAACLVAAGTATAGVAIGSRRIYCHPDRVRGTAEARHGWGALLALAWRQERWFTVGMALFGVFGALSVAFYGLTAWPVFSLVAGVVCGAVGAGPEDDPSLPRGRAWLARAAVRFAAGVGFVGVAVIATAAAFAVKAAAAERVNLQIFQSISLYRAAAGVWTQPALFVALWLVYGYAVAVFCAALFRRRLVAGGVAAAVALPLGALWVPSVFVGGGVHGWQVWGVPALLLAAAGVLGRRADGRPLGARGVGVAAGAVVASGLWTAAALAYRTAEIPLPPDAIDLDAYRASLPTPEENAGGRLAAAALRRLREIRLTFTSDDLPESLRRLPAPGGRQPPVPVTFFTYYVQAIGVSQFGWEADDPPLRAWLDRIFDDAWARDLAAAAGQPTGVLLDPREQTQASILPDADTAAVLLTARGLQRQGDGDPAAFVENLRIGLSLARSHRHHATPFGVLRSSAVESPLLRGVGNWLGRLDGRPDLLRRTLDVLRHHDDAPLPDVEDVRKADLLVTLNSLDDPQSLQLLGAGPNPLYPVARAETDLLHLALLAPRERGRVERLLNGLASLEQAAASEAFQRSPPLARLFGHRPDRYSFIRFGVHRPRGQSQRRAALLQVALRLYQTETGKPAEQLADLVPRYLPAVPNDPYDRRPYRYRLSHGEVLDWPNGDPAGRVGPPPLPGREVPPEQGILWSVGPDGRDDGGRSQVGSHDPMQRAPEDEITLVPLPPGRRPGN